MARALLVKLRPAGPWRAGPDSGAREGVDLIYHSDTLYSAVSCAMHSLGMLEEWLAATALAADGPAVRFSSCFPFHNELLYIVPPCHLWPPASSRVRWKGAQFIPVSLLRELLAGRRPDESRWGVDAACECLVAPRGTPPFRLSLRQSAAVDRLSGNAAPHVAACVEFGEGAGLWFVACFAGSDEFERWSGPVQAALRWLADSGFGGERSLGWGRAEAPEFTEEMWPDLMGDQLGLKTNGEPADEAAPTVETAYWLLSLFAPAEGDRVDWHRGHYALSSRSGRIQSPVRSGDLKKRLDMVTEGSVLLAEQPPRGAANNVAPDDFAHPVYRAGFAVAVPLPWQAS